MARPRTPSRPGRWPVILIWFESLRIGEASLRTDRLCGEQLAEEHVETLRDGVPGIVAFDERSTFFSQTASQVGVVEGPSDRSGEGGGVVREQDVAVVLDADSLRADRSGDHGLLHRQDRKSVV